MQRRWRPNADKTVKDRWGSSHMCAEMACFRNSSRCPPAKGRLNADTRSKRWFWHFVQYNVNTGLGGRCQISNIWWKKITFAERSCHLPSVLESLLRLPRSGQLRGRPGGGRRQEVPLRQRLAQQKKQGSRWSCCKAGKAPLFRNQTYEIL